MKATNSLRPSPRLWSWISISFHKITILLLLAVSCSESIVSGQIPGIPSDFDDDGFVPSFDDLGDSLSPGRLSRSFGGANELGLTADASGFMNGDLQNSFQALFDWRRDMPVIDIVNTFLDNERELPILQELNEMCPRNDFFYGANPAHRGATMQILKMMMSQTNARDAILMAATLRDKREVNPNAWLRGVYGAATFRSDLQGLQKPALIEVMPSLLINNRAVRDVRRQASLDPQERTCVRVDGSVGRDNGIENALWYWREDIMVNSHHWYWHMAYPFQTNMPRRDRRGELFAWMHHTFLARYHAERLAHGLPPVLPLNLQRGTILREPYNPHLTDSNSGRPWGARPPNTPISDVVSNAIPNVPFFISIDNRTIELGRILESVALRTLLSAFQGQIPIDNVQGIDLLGDIVEASVYSINPEYYGYFGIHNSGHVLISLAVDPLQELNLPPGPMGDAATAMRDPIFYPYHTFLDDIFEAHKRTLAPYQLEGGDWPLVFPGVEITGIQVQAPGSSVNNLQTFWGERQYDLSRGLDFNRSAVQGPIIACVRHLDHADFQYEFTVQSQSSRRATFRIWIAPRFDEKGQRYLLEEQRRRFFILDKFAIPLTAGTNRIIRNSADSLLTIDFPQSYRELNNPGTVQMPDCGCGWPHHLLLPKGNPAGMAFDLFVMITDARLDQVPSTGQPQNCRSAPIYCGIMGERYPDARPMGYPFDRAIYPNNNINPLDPRFDDIPGELTLEEWTQVVPNMAATPITITHVDELRRSTSVGQALGGGGPASQILSASPGDILDGFDPSPSLNLDPAQLGDGLPPASGDFFNEFFPSTRPARNHPKRYAPAIEPPSKEFMQLVYGK